MNKKSYISYLNIFIFLLLIYALTILNLLTPKNKSISEVENRALAQKPVYSLDNLLSGKYFRDFESFFADHFFDRENLVQTSKDITKFKGIKREEEVYLVDFTGQNVGGNVVEDESKKT